MTLISALATMSLFSQAKPVNVLPIHRSSRVLTSTRFDQDLPLSHPFVMEQKRSTFDSSLLLSFFSFLSVGSFDFLPLFLLGEWVYPRPP